MRCKNSLFITKAIVPCTVTSTCQQQKNVYGFTVKELTVDNRIMRKVLVPVIFLFLFVGIFNGCEDTLSGLSGKNDNNNEEEPENNPPLIESLSAVPTIISPNAWSGITCVATDADEDVLLYGYSATGGYFDFWEEPSDRKWIAPAQVGLYTITVTVSDGIDSTWEEIDIQVEYYNNPPNLPASPSPLNNEYNQPIELALTWICEDSEDDELTFDVYFGTDADPPLIEENWHYDHYNLEDLAYFALYYWQIVATDEHGNTTEGPVWSFRTGGPPNQPENPNPADNSTGVTISPEFSWFCVEPDGQDLEFDIYFGVSGNLELVEEEYVETSYRPETLRFFTEYSWQIVARDIHGNETEGPVWQFTTTDEESQPPDIPANPYPGNGAVNINPEVTLSWTCTHPLGDTLRYDIYMGTSADYIPPVNLNRSSNTYQTILAEQTTHYWQIIARDTQNHETAGPVWSFTTSVDDGGGGNEGIIWDGLYPSSWENNVEIVDDHIVFGGTGESFVETVSLDMTNRTQATFHYGIDFENELNPRSFAVTMLAKPVGDIHFYAYDNYQSPNEGENLSLQVYHNSWHINNIPIEAIKLRIAVFNQNQSVYLITPKITVP